MKSNIRHRVQDEKHDINRIIAVDFGTNWQRGQVDSGDVNGTQPPEHLHYLLSIEGAVYMNGDDYNNYLIQSQNRMKSFIRYDNYRNPYDTYIESCFAKYKWL